MSKKLALIGFPDGKHFVEAIRKDKSIVLTTERGKAMRFESVPQAQNWGMARLHEAFLVGEYDKDIFERSLAVENNSREE